MKKGLLFSISLVFVLSLFFSAFPIAVSAKLWEPPKDPAEGDWVFDDELDGEKVHMDDLKLLAPPAEWMRLMSNGVHLTTVGATSLCHPFPGAQDGWEGAIYLQNGNSWFALASTTEWVPDEEGQLMTCTLAPMTGTYALFGYCGEDCKLTTVKAVAVAPDLVADLPVSEHMPQ